MKGLGVTVAAATMLIGGAGSVYAADLSMSTKAPVLKAADNSTCTSISDFFLTNCQLAAYGVRIYGTVDVGGTYQTNGAPLDRFFPTGASYFQQKMNRQSMFGWGPNGLSQSNLGIQVNESLGGGWKFVAQYDFGFDPVTGEFANGPGSLVDNFGKAPGQQTTNADSGRNGTFYNGQLFAGVSNDTWGTLTVGRNNSLTLDLVNAYDSMGGAYAFSPIGFSGKVPGGGNTEDTRINTSVKYRVNIANFRLSAIAQFGGIDAGNGAQSEFQAGAGGDFHVGPGLLSLDFVGGHATDAVNLGLSSLNGGTNNFLSATISDNTMFMAGAKYTVDRLKLFAGYEFVHYAAPSDTVSNSGKVGSAFDGINVMDGANTGFNPVVVFTNQVDTKFQVAWAGARYAVTDAVEVSAAYYRYMNGQNATQNGALCLSSTSFDPANGVGADPSGCAGVMNAASVMVDWKFAPKWDTYLGTFYSASAGGLANGFLSKDNLATTAGVRFRF